MSINQHAAVNHDDTPRACEYPGCTVVVPQSKAHNLGVVYLHSAGQAPSYQCPQIEHWTCSHEHAVPMAHLCLDNHVLPLLDAMKQSHNTERWNHHALSGTHACECGHCTEKLVGHTMHGFVVTYRFPGGELNRLGVRECELHLGCSPEHAAEAAHTCMDEHTADIRRELQQQYEASYAGSN